MRINASSKILSQGLCFFLFGQIEYDDDICDSVGESVESLMRPQATRE